LYQVVVDENYVIRIPDAIDLAKAAPLLCAGTRPASTRTGWIASAAVHRWLLRRIGLGYSRTIIMSSSATAADIDARAGITTYSPLAHFGAKAKGAACTTGVIGFGGLGHVAVKLAKAMVEPPPPPSPNK
jgi:D-arabinose 1-dehydrogenase-like Zn-dependent alcohol dehydrogenase